MIIFNKTFLKAAAALLILTVSGVSIFMQPDYELAYDLPTPLVTCTKGSGCVSVYRITLGNTGRKTQDVNLVFKAAPMAEPVLPLKIKNFGVSLHPFKQKEDGNKLIIELGAVESGKRVETTFALLSRDADAVLNPEELFEGIRTQHGRVIRGSPEWIIFSRIMHRLL